MPVIVHVSTPGTDQAVELARHAEQVGADCVMAIAPYYWKPSQEQLYEHFAAIMSATELPFIAYNSPTIMDGVGLAPATLVKLMQRFPQLIGPQGGQSQLGEISSSAARRARCGRISGCSSAPNG